MVLHRAHQHIEHSSFRRLADYLLPGDLLVLNDSRVIPARLRGRKADGGGAIEVLLLEHPETDPLADRRLPGLAQRQAVVRALLGTAQVDRGRRFVRHPEPDDLLHTLEVGTFSGEDHERYAAKLDNLRDLAASDDEDIARLGRRGIDIYEPLLKEALAQARRAAVRGTRDY